MRKENSNVRMDISQVARQTKLPGSTLRYYEEKGLIRSVGRIGLRRVFNSDVIDRLALISMGKSAGFSLGEIRAMFNSEGLLKINRQQLLKKADALDEAVRQILHVRDQLRHVANCRASDHMKCPRFRRLLRRAGESMGGSRSRKRLRKVL